MAILAAVFESQSRFLLSCRVHSMPIGKIVSCCFFMQPWVMVSRPKSKQPKASWAS